MKTLKSLFCLLAVLLFVTSCNREFDTPPFNEPSYDGKANITIKELKERYAETSSNAPSLIEVAYVLKAYVAGNDDSGNIFKQLFIQDETGGMPISIDGSELGATYKVGQEIFIELHGLSIVNYGGELQIGYAGTNANRIPLETASEVIFKNGWANVNNVTPTVVKLSELKDEMVFTLVKFENVYFVDGGVKNFTENDQTTSRTVKDGNDSSIEVRTSSYSNFAETKLPAGSGTLVGILGRYNGGWQFTLRSYADIIDFGGEIPTPDPVEGLVFAETFGSADVTARPKIADYTGYDNGSPISYEGTGDIRSTAAFNNHIWMGAGEAAFTVKGINTAGKTGLALSYDITLNVYTESESGNINLLKVYYNGTELSVPSIVLDRAGGYNAKYYNVVIDISSLEMKDNSTLEFKASASDNTLGIRIDNIQIAPKNGGSINPSPVG